MSNITLGSHKTPEREQIKQSNMEINSTLQIKKGDNLKLTRLNDYTVNGEFIYDEVQLVEVISTRKRKAGLALTIRDIRFNFNFVMVLCQCPYKIEIL